MQHSYSLFPGHWDDPNVAFFLFASQSSWTQWVPEQEMSMHAKKSEKLKRLQIITFAEISTANLPRSKPLDHEYPKYD